MGAEFRPTLLTERDAAGIGDVPCWTFRPPTVQDVAGRLEGFGVHGLGDSCGDHQT